jgi:hypothetical protein
VIGRRPLSTPLFRFSRVFFLQLSGDLLRCLEQNT